MQSHDLPGLNNYRKDFIDSLFENSELIDVGNIKIYKTVIPELIWLDIQNLLLEAKKIRSHPLGLLRSHYNEGKNSFQISADKILLERSFLYPYIIFAGQKYISDIDSTNYQEMHRNVLLRSYNQHYDGYDFWFNFSNSGDENPKHTHAGSISSVIYIENTEDLATEFLNENILFQYHGKPKEMILFPSFLPHGVRKSNLEKERITASFNLIYDPNNNIPNV